MDFHNHPGYSMRYLSLIVICIAFTISCTSSRWVTQDQFVEDRDQIKLLDSAPIVSITDLPTNDRPSFKLTVFDRQLTEVPLRLQTTRVIQRYRPRYGLVALGVVGSAGLAYLATKEGVLDQELSNSQKNILYLTASGVLAGSILNMKPVGKPVYTGETRLLGQVQTIQKVDSSKIYNGSVDVIINAAYNGESLVTGLQKTIVGQQEVNLLNDLGLRTFSPPDTGSIQIQVTSEYEILEFDIPLSSFMNRYVRIATRNTPLRNSPAFSSANVVTTVAETSLLPWLESADDWYRVMLGTTPVYVPITEGDLIWRFGSGTSSELVVTTSAGTYGSVDIERDIPVTSIINNRAIAVIIANDEYESSSFRSLPSMRSAQLVAEYLNLSLGYKRDRIITITNIKADSDANSLLQIDFEAQTIHGIRFSTLSDLFIYYVGHGGIIEYNGNYEPAILPVDMVPGDGIPLSSLFHELRSLNVASISVLLDTDFTHRYLPSLSPLNADRQRQFSGILTQGNPSNSVIYSVTGNQVSGAYQSNDLRTDRVHGILTYYWVKAIQSGISDMPTVFQYLQRNMTFTSRRLHNRAQDPFGVISESTNLLRFTTEF